MKKAGFTLAEVLITLAIIGVVAALTIPTVVKNYQKTQTIVKLKKNYSILNQALKRSEIENGAYSTWDSELLNTPQIFFETYWKPHLRVQQMCSVANNYCGYKIATPWQQTVIAGMESSMGVQFLLTDGSFILIRTAFGNIENKVSYILVDINGAKGPNVAGRDVFEFLYNDKGVLPYCHTRTKSQVDAGCKSDSKSCCTDKIMREGWEIKDDYPW